MGINFSIIIDIIHKTQLRVELNDPMTVFQGLFFEKVLSLENTDLTNLGEKLHDMPD